MDFDDTWHPATHPSGAVLPAVLALSDMMPANGKPSGPDFLLAFNVGIEIQGRLMRFSNEARNIPKRWVLQSTSQIECMYCHSLANRSIATGIKPDPCWRGFIYILCGGQVSTWVYRDPCLTLLISAVCFTRMPVQRNVQPLSGVNELWKACYYVNLRDSRGSVGSACTISHVEVNITQDSLWQVFTPRQMSHRFTCLFIKYWNEKVSLKHPWKKLSQHVESHVKE